MIEPTFDSVNVGDIIPELHKPPITRATLALFAGASNDHNPMHIDIDFARSAGLDDVIAHGLLIMAYMGQALTNWVPQEAMRRIETKFISMTPVGAEITCSGTIVEKWVEDGANLVRIDLRATDQAGNIKLSGQSVVSLP